MTLWPRPSRVAAALALVLSIFCQGTLVLAGTTGGLSGIVSDASTHQPISGAKVTAVSPSQSVTVTTDASGRFNFLALAPDTYTISVSTAGYDTANISGETVIADSTRTVTIAENKALQTIGKVTSRASTDLVKPGTTADVYSINPTQQDKLSGLGGGGNLNSAWSALASVPGVFVTPGQGGYIGAGATLSIRGGDYDQIGYEIDGVPVNRAFDNYPSGTASSLGQQELQVYTGGAPASAEAQGLSGFINQVIRTGTYPASSNITADIGGPTFYHKFSAETGGATQSRNFSYYVGLGGYNQDFRYGDQFNGAGISQLYGIPLTTCASIPVDKGALPSPSLFPSCYTAGQYNGNTGAGSYVLGGNQLFLQSTIADRDNVFNVHFGFPHKNGTKDDLQLLAVINHLSTSYYDSTNDQGGLAFTNALYGGAPTYPTGYQYNGPTGGLLPANYTGGNVVQYYFPRTGSNIANDSMIPVDQRDGISNDQNIFKAQYTHALGSNAILKVYGYTYYSDWLQLGAQTAFANYFGPAGPDYELSSHTRGVSAQFIDQLPANNLLTLQGAYTSASTLRDNNSEFNDSGTNVSLRTVFGALVDSTNPYSGLCYTRTGTATTCRFTSAANGPFITLKQAFNGSVTTPAATCGGGPCEYLVVGNGQYATYNTVKPKFSSLSLTDQWKPSAKLTVDAGVRLDRFEYEGSDTTGTAARTFWYNAYNLDNCVTTAAPIAVVPRTPGAACGPGATPANFTNPTGNVTEGYNEYQPRIGFTYTLDPTSVVRASYGRIAQAPNSAYQQYNALEADAPQLLYGTYGFQQFGFTQPNHTVVPPTSNNLDLSVEHQFGRDTSVKISPFIRKTQNQIQNFFLNQQTGFVSGLNVGNQTSEGVELEVDKGNFSRNGLAAKLSLAYTNSFIKYQRLSNGSSIIDPLNAQIKTYNAYTSYCAKNPTATACAGGATATGVAGAPCYTPVVNDANGAQVGGGLPDPACAATSVANPYWNAPVQGLLDPNGNYPTFDIFPAGIGSAVQGYGAPYTATLLLQYKHNKLAVTPALQFFGGQRYGAPASTLGVSPDACSGILTGSAAGDPRYSYGAPGGAGFDYGTCGTLTGGIPDPYTGKFDTIGAFVAPSQLQLHLQLTYDITNRISIVTNLANLVNTCFGGTKTGFNVKGACTYNYVANGATGGVGNTYNPGSAIQPYVAAPYVPFFSTSPFSVYVSARVRL